MSNDSHASSIALEHEAQDSFDDSLPLDACKSIVAHNPYPTENDLRSVFSGKPVVPVLADCDGFNAGAGWQNDIKRRANNSSNAIDGSVEPFLTKPWWKPGHEIRGKQPGVLYVNESSVRARAGLLMLFATVSISTLVGVREEPYKVVRWYLIPAFLEFVASITFGFTPFAPFGSLAILLARHQPPVWKPYKPKRFAWSLGLMMILACGIICILAQPPYRFWWPIHNRRFYLVGLASVCLVLAFLEAALGFCFGCYIHSILANWLGWEKCTECSTDSKGITRANSMEATLANSRMQRTIATNDIVIFSKKNCPYCVMAKELLDQLGQKYQAVEVDDDNETGDASSYLPALIETTQQRTFPYVFVKGKFIGGATDLARIASSGGLSEQLSIKGISDDEDSNKLRDYKIDIEVAPEV